MTASCPDTLGAEVSEGCSRTPNLYSPLSLQLQSARTRKPPPRRLRRYLEERTSPISIESRSTGTHFCSSSSFRCSKIKISRMVKVITRLTQYCNDLMSKSHT